MKRKLVFLSGKFGAFAVDDGEVFRMLFEKFINGRAFPVIPPGITGKQAGESRIDVHTEASFLHGFFQMGIFSCKVEYITMIVDIVSCHPVPGIGDFGRYRHSVERKPPVTEGGVHGFFAAFDLDGGLDFEIFSVFAGVDPADAGGLF